MSTLSEPTNNNTTKKVTVLLQTALHYIKNQPIKDLLVKDKDYSLSLPKIPFSTATIKTRKINKVGKFTLNNLYHYYINPKYANQTVAVKCTHNQIIVYNQLNKQISRLPRLFGATPQTQIDWQQYLPTIITKPNSINNLALTNLFSEKLRLYILNLDKPSLKKFLIELNELAKTKNSIEEAIKAMDSKY